MLADERWFQKPPPEKWQACAISTKSDMEEFLALAEKPLADRKKFLSQWPDKMDGLVVLRPANSLADPPQSLSEKRHNKSFKESPSHPSKKLFHETDLKRAISPKSASSTATAEGKAQLTATTEDKTQPTDRADGQISSTAETHSQMQRTDTAHSQAQQKAPSSAMSGATSADPVFICDFYNKDGSKADMCGNAACCLSFYAEETGLPKGDFLLGAGLVSREDGGGIALQAPKPSTQQAYNFKGKKIPFHFINTGVPHAVIECPPSHTAKWIKWDFKTLFGFFNRIEGSQGLNRDESPALRPTEKTIKKQKKLIWLWFKFLSLFIKSVKAVFRALLFGLQFLAGLFTKEKIKQNEHKTKQKRAKFFVEGASSGVLDFNNKQALKELARRLRFENPKNKKEGMNVSFFQIKTSQKGAKFSDEGALLRAVTFERGVEDFTLSCGTGALAVASVYKQKSPQEDLKEVFMDFPGGRLKVRWEGAGKPRLFSLVKKGW